MPTNTTPANTGLNYTPNNGPAPTPAPSPITGSPAAITPQPSQTQSTDVTTLGQPTLSSSQLPQPSPYSPAPVPDLSTITAQAAAPTASQGQYDDITSQIGQLTGQLGGQTDFANNLQTQYNVPQLTSTANDLTANISKIQNQRDAVQQNLASQYGGDASKGYLDFEQQSVDSVLAAKQSAYASTLATINGQLSTAKSYIDTAVANKYTPIENQIDALNKQAALVKGTLDNEQQKQLAVMQAQLADRSAQITANKAITSSALEKIATAAANPGNPAPGYIVTEAQNAALSDNPASYLDIIAPYLQDPLAAKQEAADIQDKLASAASSYADVGLKNAQADLAKANAGIINPDGSTTYSPTTIGKYTRAANTTLKNYIALPAYQLLANAQPMLARISAASATPGSVSDQELLDSVTKLDTGGGQITEAQVGTILGGSSLADKAATWAQQMASNGGVLSPNQRQQLMQVANAVYQNYQTSYAPVYQQATAALQAQGIPQAFWNIPDLNNLGQNASDGSAGSAASAPPPEGATGTLPNGTPVTMKNGVPTDAQGNKYDMNGNKL